MAVNAPWRISATVIIMSKTTGRILMMRRGPTAKFMPGAYVFPGGLLGDYDEKMGPGTQVCALREAFEETGLLLTGHGVESAASCTKLAEVQDMTNSDPSSFQRVFDKTAIKSLIPMSTWLTPTAYPKRFISDFFLLPVEGEPEVRMCQREMSEYGWERPSECLEKGEGLPPPQVYKMTVLTQYTIPELKARCPIQRVIAPQKVISQDGVNVAMVLPGDHLYIEKEPEFVPLRTVEDEELSPNLKRPTHRVQYTDLKDAKTLWKDPRVYQHCLQEPYLSIFRPIKCHSNEFGLK